MARGIIYVMTTVVPGLIKIGKTGTDNYESRMYQLERNGYYNVVGLKRRFAIEVEDYDEKEKLLDEIFVRVMFKVLNYFHWMLIWLFNCCHLSRVNKYSQKL